jgi:uncharacterized membrane protein
MRPERQLDLLAVVALAGLDLAFSLPAAFFGDGVLRPVVGLPMVVAVPGYAIAAAVWPRTGLRPAERFTLSLGISLALAAVGGLVLYWTAAGLRPVPWALLLGVPTLVAAATAWVRRARLAPPAEAPRAARRPLAVPVAVMLGAAAVLTMGAVGIAVAGASQQREAFSELWMVPDSTSAPDSTSDQLTVGLRSMELQPTHFRVQVRAGDTVAFDAPDIVLANGQTWQTSLTVASNQSASASIEAVVYRADAPDTPYRRVQVRLPQKG